MPDFSRTDRERKRDQDQHFEKMQKQADGWGQFDKTGKSSLSHSQEMKIRDAQKDMRKIIQKEAERNRKYGLQFNPNT